MAEETKFNEITLNKVADTLKVSAEDLKSALVSDKETSIIPEGTFYTSEEVTTLETNIGNIKYKEGSTAGREMTVKEIKNFNGLDFEGKEISILNEKLADKFKEAGSKEPNEKIKDLNSTIDGLRTNVTEQTSTIDNLQGQIKTQETTNALINSMPKNLTMDKNDAATLFKVSHTISEDDGQTVIKRNGQILKDDKLKQPLSLEQAILNFSTEKGWLNGNGNSRSGRGDGSNGSSTEGSVFGITDAATFNAHCEEKGIKPHTKEQTALLSEVMKANPDFKLE